MLNDNNVNVIISYQNERLKDRVKKLLDESKIPFKAYQCDLSIDPVSYTHLTLPTSDLV